LVGILPLFSKEELVSFIFFELVVSLPLKGAGDVEGFLLFEMESLFIKNRNAPIVIKTKTSSKYFEFFMV
jgi:hypothetical protein